MEPNNKTSESPEQAKSTVNPAPSAPSSASQQTVVVSPKKPKIGKKSLIIVLVLLILLVIVGAAGYYYYANMMNTPAEEMTAVPTLEPTATPTQDPDQITDGSELDGVVNDLDNATDEANMTQEVQGLQTDSNF